MEFSTKASTDSIVPVRVGRVLVAACWVAVAYGTASAVPRLATFHDVVAWIIALIFLITLTAAVERPNATLLLLISGLASAAMQYLAPGTAAFVAVTAAIAVAGVRLDYRFSRPVAGLSATAFLVASALGVNNADPSKTVSVVPAVLFTYLGASAMRRLRIEQRRTEELLNEAIAGRDARVRVAALDERARLAREMHDVLAHTLSALSIQLQGTRLLAEQRESDPDVVSALGRASGLAREGLAEARRAVGSLRGETLPGPDLLPLLAGDFERDTGLPCRLQIEGHPTEFTSEARLALYRIAQEALTNVRKHASASAVQIVLRYTSNGAELIVDNEGVPCPRRYREAATG